MSLKIFSLVLIFFSACQCSEAQDKLKVLVIFAHPDEGEIYAGGIAALYSQMGHEVKFLSLTNGDAGHYSMKPVELAERRFAEAMKSKSILGLSDYEVMDYHDGYLENTEEVWVKVARKITEWKADIVFTFYPAAGGHNDNMNTGWIVREASSLLDRDKIPVFIYFRDYYTARFTYIPDFAIIIDEVWEVKLAACGAHESQVIEYNPNLEGVLDEVLASKEKQKEFLFHNTYPYSRVTPDHLAALSKWYGREKAAGVKYAEAFEIAEYGRQVTEKDITGLFPMIGKVITISGKTDWTDTGQDIQTGQILKITAEGKIIWKMDGRESCGPDGAFPYTPWGHKPIPGINTGALIGKIGEGSTTYFFIGSGQEINASNKGRLYLGINDDNTSDNEGEYRVWIQRIIK